MAFLLPTERLHKASHLLRFISSQEKQWPGLDFSIPLVRRSIMGPSVRNQVNIIPMSNIPCESSWISTSGTLLQRHPSLPCINLPPPVHFFFFLPHSRENAIATHSSPSYKRKKKISPSHIFWILFSLRNSMNKFTSSVIRFSFAFGARYSLIQSF